MNPRVSLLLVACLSLCSRADEGELSVGFETTPGWYWVSNSLSRNGGFSSTFMQRFSIPLNYGLTDVWSLGINPSLSFSYGDVVSNDVTIQNLSGNLSSRLLWLTIPVQTSFRVNSGTNFSAIFEFFGGYSVTYWSDRFLEKNNYLVLGESSLPSRWNHGAVFGTQVLFEYRFIDWLVVQAGPSMTVTSMEGWGFCPGVSIRVLSSFGVGRGLSSRPE